MRLRFLLVYTLIILAGFLAFQASEAQTVPPASYLPIVLDQVMPTPTATLTPTPFLVNELRAFINPTLTATTVWLRLAPANTQTPVTTLVAGSEVHLWGRDQTGEWVYFCCVENNQPRWVRQAYAQPTGNPMPPNAPPSSTPDDVRWLPTVPWPGNIPPLPIATPIPQDDYPLPHHDRANTGRVPLPFSTNPFRSTIAGLTSGRITTPVVVAGQFVIAASADGNIYGFDRGNGNQIWKFPVGSVTQPLLVVDNILYYVDSATSKAVAIALGSSEPLWTANLNVPNVLVNAQPASGFVAVDNRLYVVVTSNSTNYVVQMDRTAGGALGAFRLDGPPPQALAVGARMLYVAGQNLWALDVDNLELVWSRSDINSFLTAPVYAANGVLALAELYVTNNDGRVFALDANTGANVLSYPSNDQKPTALAIGDAALYVAGPNFIKAFERRSTGMLWTVVTNGNAPGGPIVTPDQIILVSDRGLIQLVHPGTGLLTSGGSVSTTVTKAPAVGGSDLFIPGEDGHIYGFTQ